MRAGLAAVAGRLREGTLRVVEGSCPNLLAEAALYRYRDDKTDRESEEPENEHNHALDALRYLIMGLDAGRPPRRRVTPSPDTPPANTAACSATRWRRCTAMWASPAASWPTSFRTAA